MILQQNDYNDEHLKITQLEQDVMRTSYRNIECDIIKKSSRNIVTVFDDEDNEEIK